MKKMMSLVAAVVLVGSHVCWGQATPEAAVKEFKEALEKGNASHVIALLPPTYVKDVTGLVHDFAGKMDAEIWTKLRTVLGGATGALGSKASLLVDMSANDPEKPVTAEQKAARTKALTEALGAASALMKHEITSLDKLKTVDAATFAREVSAVFAKSTAAMKALEADAGVPKAEDFKVLKSEKRENGNVALTFAAKDGTEGETEEFAQVEGRWVPAEMAGEWTKSMQEARDGLKKLDFTTPEGQATKAQTMMMLGMFEPMVQQISQAQTAEQLQGMFGSMMMPLMMMGGGMGGGAGAPGMMPPPAPVPGN